MDHRYISGINILGNTQTYPISQQLSMLKEIGWGAFFTGWDRENLAQWAEEAERLGLVYQSVHAPFVGINHLWKEGERGAAYTQQLIDCVTDCHNCGIPVMVIHPFIGFDEHTPTQIGLDNYARVVEVADRLDVRLGFENVEGEEYLTALMKAFWDAPSCGFCLDTGHELCYNGAKNMLAQYGAKLCHTHFNDNLGVYDPTLTWENDFHLLMGDGIVDWNGVMDRIDATDYRGVLMCELSLSNKPNRHTHDAYAAMPLEEFYALALERWKQIVSRKLISNPIAVE